MAHIKDIKGGIETVSQLIEALKSFPADMPVHVEFREKVSVYRLEPQKGEEFEDKRGCVCLNGDFESY